MSQEVKTYPKNYVGCWINVRHLPIGILMQKLAAATKIACLTLLVLHGCSTNTSIADLYIRLKNSSKQKNKTIVAQQGPINISKYELYYINSSGRLLTNKDILKLPDRARDLIIKRILLRRLSIYEGMNRSIYITNDAVDYILPRLEKILEDYYYIEAANIHTSSQQIRKALPSEQEIRESLKSKSHHDKISSELIEYERSKITRRIEIRMREIEKRKVVESLLQKYPEPTINHEYF